MVILTLVAESGWSSRLGMDVMLPHVVLHYAILDVQPLIGKPAPPVTYLTRLNGKKKAIISGTGFSIAIQ